MRKTGLLIVLVSALAYGCKDSDKWQDELSAKVLSVAEVSFGIKPENNLSKSGFDTGDKIGLHVYRNQNPAHHGLTYLNPGWALDSPVSLPDGKVDIYATYPYDTENNNPDSYVIEHASQTDYLYSSKHTASLTNPALYLRMKHALALIEFKFSTTPAIENNSIDFIAVEGLGLYSKARLNLQSGILEYEKEKIDSAIIHGWQLDSDYIYEGMTVGIMVVPVERTSYEGEIFFSFFLDGFIEHWPVPAGTSWESNKKYTYNVHVYERDLEITDVKIQEWIDGGYEKIPLPYR